MSPAPVYTDSCQAPIKVVFAPGAYGHYLTSCLYLFTNLNDSGEVVSVNSNNSHNIREQSWFGNKIYCEHVDAYKPGSCQSLVVMVPEKDHRLDYFVNNWVKSYGNDWYNWMSCHVSEQYLEQKLRAWDYDGNVDLLPGWLQREFLSLHLMQWLDASYDPNQYLALDAAVLVGTQQLFGELVPTLHEIANATGLRLIINDHAIETRHQQFLEQQRYHNIQNRCKHWCDSVISNVAVELELDSLVLESWMQAYLRQQGYEVRCQDLAAWPSSSLTMRSYTYEVG